MGPAHLTEFLSICPAFGGVKLPSGISVLHRQFIFSSEVFSKGHCAVLRSLQPQIIVIETLHTI